MIPDLAWAFFTGLVGSLHCLGMCGPLVVAYSLQLRPKRNTATSSVALSPWSSGLRHHFMFHLGRMTTYGFLGALAAGFVSLGMGSSFLIKARSLTVLVGGAVMVVFGLLLLKVMPVYFKSAGSASRGGLLNRFISVRLASGAPASGLVLGMAAGFLPCMLSWAMVVKAATAGSALAGFSTMLFFGLGTAPALFFTGFFASLFSLRMRLTGERIAAASLIIMGLILFCKGASRLV